jgi:hypothetical protein
MEFTTPYKISKNYTQLFELICIGHEIPCIVDYSYRDNDKKIYRDLCRVRRPKDFFIMFGSRGIEYGSISSWHKENGEREIDYFVELCKSLNVEFIEI